jgi:hypothetical protein
MHLTTSTPITKNSNVEAYDIALDTHIQPQTILSTIPNTFEKHNDIIIDKGILSSCSKTKL